jgi:CRISPR-associated endonuclease Cas1
MHGKLIGEPTCVFIIRGISAGNKDRTGLPTVRRSRQALTTKGGATPMAAAKNVLQLSQSHNSSAELIVPRHGVVTLFGYGIQIRVDRGHLLLEDGIGADRRYSRFAKVGHGLKRLVCIGSDGFVSLSALRWLADQDAAFVMLERNGKVHTVCGPVSPSNVKLRRSQALAVQNGKALELCRTLIAAKLEGQERVVREQLKDKGAADVIARFRISDFRNADNIERIRTIEAHAAISYFSCWRDIPVMWPKLDLQKIPQHWRTVGARHSPLSGGPRLAVTPVHAILNYCSALLEAESRLALACLGLDPGLGLGLHTDTANRDSLTLDVLEPVRPQLESWLLRWITSEPLRRSDFFETPSGNVRLMAELCKRLSETAPTWGKLVAPWAEHVARALWERGSGGRALATRLTQAHKREAKGRPGLPRVEMPQTEHACLGCGKRIARRGDDRHHCAKCAKKITIKSFDAGRRQAHKPEHLAKRSVTMSAHTRAIKNWKTSDLPIWLTRDVYTNRIIPALANVPRAQIRKALSVSEPYSIYIHTGKIVPHKRHWKMLADLAGIRSTVKVHSPLRQMSHSGSELSF